MNLESTIEVLRTEISKETPYRRKRRRFDSVFAVLTIIFFLLIVFGAALLSYLHYVFDLRTAFRHVQHGKSCTEEQALTRREWRRLTIEEQNTYLKAVQCLQRTPGHVSEEQSLYLDFPYHHSRAGNISHNSALFLSWHRLLLSAFEKSLHANCNYSGTIPYWDWTLDHKDLSRSPVFDPIHGFGGNGTSPSLDSGLPAAGNGSCVTDGPFANMTLFYTSQKRKPHCLSRGFGFSLGDDPAPLGRPVSPAAVEEVLSQDTFDKMWKKMEHGPHDALPHFIHGDFSFLTAPNDPLFFSHHAQLDRLWWLWQMRDRPRRLMEYNGRASNRGSAAASLTDVIDLAGLGEPTTVENVMDTMGGFLCYRYA